MKPSELFEVCVRVIGLIAFLLSLFHFANIVTFLPVAGTGSGLDGPTRYAALLAAPSVLLLAGLLFLFGGRTVTRIVFGRAGK